MIVRSAQDGLGALTDREVGRRSTRGYTVGISQVHVRPLCHRRPEAADPWHGAMLVIVCDVLVQDRVGAENRVTLYDLGMLADQGAEAFQRRTLWGAKTARGF
jgi:hypothetical protein